MPTMDESKRPAKWDLDSDEIASVASEDLYQNRPNRWTGPKSSWRTLTAEERQLWRSMRQLEHQDLGVHLYDAFALKRQGRDPATARMLTIQTVGVFPLTLRCRQCLRVLGAALVSRRSVC